MNLSKGADRVGGQLRGDKECPFSGVTKSGRVWRKVPESDAGSVCSRRSPTLPSLQSAVAIRCVHHSCRPSCPPLHSHLVKTSTFSSSTTKECDIPNPTQTDLDLSVVNIVYFLYCDTLPTIATDTSDSETKHTLKTRF